MKIFIHILLGICSAACAAALILQGFLFPSLPQWADLLLRLAGAMLVQMLTLRICEKKLLRYAPLMVSAIAAVWGFFLLLSSPSWIHATTAGFLQDYASFFGGCLLVSGFALALPRLKRGLKRFRRYLRRRRKQKKQKDIPHS